MKIIAFGHRQRVGKDSAAKFLISHLKSELPGVEVCRVAMFDWVKDLAAEMFGWAGLQDRVYYDNHPEYRSRVLPAIEKTPRQIWLELGYYLRQIHPDCIPENAFRLGSGEAQIAIVPDLRSEADIAFVDKFNGLKIRIDRDVPKLESEIPQYLVRHPAYMLDKTLEDYSDWHETWDNNGSLRDLNNRVTDFVRRRRHEFI